MRLCLNGGGCAFDSVQWHAAGATGVGANDGEVASVGSVLAVLRSVFPRWSLFWVVGILAVGSLGIPNRAVAAVELTELLDEGAAFAVDALVFDQFVFSSDGTMPSAAGVRVGAFTDAQGNVGIMVSGGFSDTPATDGPSTMELGYRVSSTDGRVFTGATLAGNPAVIGEGSFTLTESSDSFKMSLVVFDTSPGDTQLLESVALDGQHSSLDVFLSLVGDVQQGAGTASFAQQTFALGNGPNEVIPEPSTIVIWGLGFAIAGGFRIWSSCSAS